MNWNPQTSLKCADCGHIWKARSNTPKSPQCSKCRSRQIEEVGNEKTFEHLTAKETPISEPMAFRKNELVSPQMKEDPDVQKKMKELQLVRLERQIAEEQGALENTKALERLEGIFRVFVQGLVDEGVVDTDYIDYFNHFCIWCGAEEDKGVQFNPSKHINACVTCGRA